MRKQILFGLVLAGLLMSFSAKAAFFKSGEEVNIGDVADNLYLAGATANVSGNVEGDLFVAGGEVNVSSKTKVSSDLRLVGGDVTIGSVVTGETLVAAGSLKFLPEAKVSKNVYIAAGNVILAGQFEGDVTVYAGSLIVDPSTKIAGTLKYVAEKEIQLPSGVQVANVIFQQSSSAKEKTTRGASMFATFLAMVGQFLALAIVSSLVFYFFGKKKVVEFFSSDFDQFGKRALQGFAGLVLAPIAIALVLATLIGYYVAVVGLALYVSLLIFATILAPIALALLLQKYLFKKSFEELDYSQIVLGVFVLQILSLIPLIGWLAELVIFLFVFGIFWERAIQLKRPA